MVSGHRQGKLDILLTSSGNELQVEHRYGKTAAVVPSEHAPGWSIVLSGERIGKSTGKH